MIRRLWFMFAFAWGPSALADPHEGLEASPVVPRHADDAAARSAPVSPTEAVVLGGSAYAAGMSFRDHPRRSSGFEAQARVDVWRGLEWGIHAAYTVDVFDADDAMTGTASTTAYHDFNLGGGARITPRSWGFAELHLLEGATAYGSGGAAFAGVGRTFGAIEVEVGAGAVQTSGAIGYAVTARVAHPRVVSWLGLGLDAISTYDMHDSTAITTEGPKLAVGPEVTIGAIHDLTLVCSALFGERTFAMLSRGQVVENTPDVVRTTLQSTLWWAFSKSVSLYVGGSVRTATTPVSHEYNLISAFTGAAASF
jgi:hypothetical protein